MKQFTKKLTAVGRDLSIIISSYVIAIVMFAFIILFLLLLAVGSGNSISQERIHQLVISNQDDLEMIVEDLRSYDMPRVSVYEENITTYVNLVRIPDGRYMLGEKGPDFSTSEELQRFMKELKISSIKFTLYDELQIVTFEFYDDRIKGAYWVDPDAPTEKPGSSRPYDLTPSGDGWECKDYSNRYYTEKICDNWYYYVVET